MSDQTMIATPAASFRQQADAERILAEDPFHQAGVADYPLTELQVSKDPLNKSWRLIQRIPKVAPGLEACLEG